MMKKSIICLIILAGFVGACIVIGCYVGLICFHHYTDPTCLQSAVCVKCGKQGDAPLGHSWVEATCVEPKHCTRCGATEGDALGHSFVPATCTQRSFCSRCGIEIGSPLGHDYSPSTWTLPSICKRCNEMLPMERPSNGVINMFESGRGSKLNIDNTRGSSDCYIKLKDSSGNEVLSFYVRKGTSFSASVPEKSMYVYFSYGDDWYGPEYAFGVNGHYSKDDEIADFYNYEIEYTLYEVQYGNFSETPISYNSF